MTRLKGISGADRRPRGSRSSRALRASAEPERACSSDCSSGASAGALEGVMADAVAKRPRPDRWTCGAPRCSRRSRGSRRSRDARRQRRARALPPGPAPATRTDSAQTANDVATGLVVSTTRTSSEARRRRIQAHRVGDDVAVFTRTSQTLRSVSRESSTQYEAFDASSLGARRRGHRAAAGRPPRAFRSR